MKRFLSIVLITTLLSTPAMAAWTVTHVKNNHNASNTSLTQTAVTVSANHLLVLGIGVRPGGSGDTISASDSVSDSFTVKTCPVTGTGRAAVAYAITSGLSSGTVTVSSTATYTDLTVDIVDISGNVTSSPEDTAVYQCNSGSSTGPTVTSGAPTQTLDLMFGVTMYTGSATSYTEDAAWTVLTPFGDTNLDAHDATFQPPATAANTRTEVLGVSKGWNALTIGFKAPGGVAASSCTRSLLGVGC